MNSQANATQVGGNHYNKSSFQHWDLVARTGMDYFQGQATKYLTRWRYKNGLVDLRKAQHFVSKYMELASSPHFNCRPVEYAPRDVSPGVLADYAKANALTQDETLAISLIVNWDGRLKTLDQAANLIGQIVREAEMAAGELAGAKAVDLKRRATDR